MAAVDTMQVTFPEPDVALVTLDTPGKGANVFSRAVIEELGRHLDELERRSGLQGLIIASGKPGIFIAGADLREFAAATNITKAETIEVASRGRTLFERFARMPFVSVAAIDGICVGGGAELAVWCDRRLMSDSPKAQIGFPEVKLGMFPGWGGTVRAPRIVGLSNAVELITSGESIDGRTAAQMGLTTDCVPSGKLLESAIALVRAEQNTGQFRRDRERWNRSIDISDMELMFLGATASAVIQQQTKGQYPAPVAALNLMLETAGVSAAEAGPREAEEFAELFGTPINRALINVFFLTDRNKKDTGVAGAFEPKPIRSVGVFGAGIMGSGIAAASVKREMSVTINDAQPQALAAGVQRALEEVAYNKVTKGADPERLLKFAPLVNATTVDVEFAGCDLVIEAVIESENIKRELYARIEPVLRPDAILASNTSAISIGALAGKLKHPERFVGIHFFNPVRKMPLVEVIRGPRTSDETVATAVAFAKRIGKSPIVVQDGPGFLVNRLLLPYMIEALELLCDGMSMAEIDSAAKSFGMPMGPITLYDVVGLDTALFAGGVIRAAFPDRVLDSALLAEMVAAGRKGQKSGRGFFRHDDPKGRPQPDPELEPLLAKHRRAGRGPITKQQAIDRLFLPMVLEASRVLQERLVRDARDVDLGMIFGTGFPPFRGGLLFWADTLGAAKIMETLKNYESLGPRFQPTPLLLELARSGRKFYDSGEAS